MHVVVLADEVPAVQDAAGYVFPCFIDRLSGAGHTVSCCFLLEPSSPEDARVRTGRIEALMARGVHVVPLVMEASTQRRTWRVRMRQLLRPTIAGLYPWAAWAPQVERVLSGLNPDVIFLFETYQGLVATHGLAIAPHVALLGDPAHLPAHYRKTTGLVRESPSLKSWYRSILERHRVRAMQGLLADLDGGGAVAAHHAEWFRRNGFSGCRYLRNPVPDLAGPDWRARRAAYPPQPKPKIILVGQLRGTATLSGIYLFAEEILPILEARLGPEKFEAHIIGRFPPPPDLAKKLSRPSVRLRGFVEDLDPEWLTADLFLVPTPIELGVRTRVIFGWMFGCCVVAHQVNVPGLPEMRHDENALIARDGRGLAEAIIRALRDPSLRAALGERGRATYERWFTPEVAGRRLVEELARLNGRNGRCKSSS